MSTVSAQVKRARVMHRSTGDQLTVELILDDNRTILARIGQSQLDRLMLNLDRDLIIYLNSRGEMDAFIISKSYTQYEYAVVDEQSRIIVRSMTQREASDWIAASARCDVSIARRQLCEWEAFAGEVK